MYYMPMVCGMSGWRTEERVSKGSNTVEDERDRVTHGCSVLDVGVRPVVGVVQVVPATAHLYNGEDCAAC